MKNCAHIQQHSKAQNNHTSQYNEDALCIYTTTLEGSTTRKHYAHTQQQHSKQSHKSIQGSTTHTHNITQTIKTIIQVNTIKEALCTHTTLKTLIQVKPMKEALCTHTTLKHSKLDNSPIPTSACTKLVMRFIRAGSTGDDWRASRDSDVSSRVSCSTNERSVSCDR